MSSTPTVLQVYRAFLYGVHPVAVKVFQAHAEVPQEEFWREINILRTCRHRNIVQARLAVPSFAGGGGLVVGGRGMWAGLLDARGPCVGPLSACDGVLITQCMRPA